MNKAVFKAAIAEIIEVPNAGPQASINPYLTLAKFVFADDKGNDNNQGIELADFGDVTSTAIDMPVKMNFTGAGVGNHLGSYVVGHIRSMDQTVAEDGSNQLIASAVLYAEEYPEEITYLKDAFASGDAPGISYEMAFGDSIIKNGIQWLKKITTCAATFVRSPAYGKRTALLALASAKDDSEFFETMRTFIAQAEEKSGVKEKALNNKGGINVDELEKAKQDIETLKTEAATKSTEISELKEKLESVTTENTTLSATVATLEREKKVESRVRKFTDAGFTLEADAEKADKKKEFWLTLSDESFDEYMGDLVAAKATAKPATPNPLALASLNNTLVPKLDPTGDTPEGLSFNFRDN